MSGINALKVALPPPISQSLILPPLPVLILPLFLFLFQIATWGRPADSHFLVEMIERRFIYRWISARSFQVGAGDHGKEGGKQGGKEERGGGGVGRRMERPGAVSIGRHQGGSGRGRSPDTGTDGRAEILLFSHR